MRKITHIVLHCSATVQSATVEAIQRFWRDVRKWKDPGYHHIIEASGKVHNLQPIEKPSNGVAGHNAHSIHICYIGGIDKNKKPIDNRTDAQIYEQMNLILTYKEQFPDVIVCGHRDFPGVTKACPSFDVKAWLKEKNIG